MKVVHLCTQDFGGAGNAAYRLHKGLQAIGIDSTFIVLDKKCKDPSVKVIPDNQQNESSYCNSPDSYSSSRMKLMWKYWTDMLTEYPGRAKGLEIFTDNTCSVRLGLVKEITEADIVNLHWVAGMINFKELPSALKGKNIVWTLHDMNPFTGGCHYTGKCNKFLNGCNACPQLGSISQKDKSYYSFCEKGEAYKELQINIVTPSKWLRDEAKRSSLFSKFQVDVIPYGLPLDAFKVYEKDELRKKLNIPLSKKIILFGANDVMNHRKGFSLLLDTLEQLADQNEGDVALGIFGDLPPGTPIQSRYEILNFGTINSENTLALVYSLSDVFVLPSLEDNLPNTVLESLACGTPVVAFNIGGMPDMISHKKTGYLADEGDIKELGEGISWILRNNSNDSLRNYCREFAVGHYDLQIQANAYLQKYNEILNMNSARQSGEGEMINLNADNWDAYTFSKRNHFDAFEKLPGFNAIDPDKCDLKVYQDLLVFNFIKNNIPSGAKLLEIGGGNSRVIEALKNNYECWNIDKFEGNGNGPTAITDKNGFHLVLDYIGNFNSDLPENYFDGVFSISALEHVPENEETYKNILKDIDRVLKPGGYSFHCFDVVLQRETTWTNGLLPFLFNKTKTLNDFIPFEDIPKEDDLYVMSKDSYEYYWHKYTDKSYEEFGRPLSYNIFWQKTATPKVESPFVPIIKDKNEFPKISIVTPSFNQGEYLEECIDSILSQNYPNLEYVVMDGGSSDNSVEIIKKYERFLSYWQSKPDGGQYQAIQTGFEKTTGSIMSWLNSDDKLHPNALYKIAYLFTSFPTVEWATGRPSFWNKEGELTGIHEIMPKWTRERLLAKKYNDPFIQQESTFWKRSLWEKAGGHLDTSLDLAGDLELWLRFSRFANLYSFNSLIAGWRNHGDQKALMFMDKYNEEAEAAIEKEIIHWNEVTKILPVDGDTIINFENRMIENNEGVNLSSIRNEYAWKSYDKDINKIKDYAGQKNKPEILSLLETEFHINNVQNDQAFITSSKSVRNISKDEIIHNEKFPRISIITPSYNQGEFLEDTIKSVLDQNYPNIEYIIIDGGSSDNSIEIIKKYEKYLSYWVSEKDNGQTDAINKGFKKATGDIVAWLNSDDYYFPGALNLIAEMYLSDPDAGLYIGNGAVADRSGEKIRRYSHDIIFDYETLLKGSNYILQPSTFINAKAINEVGYLDVSLFYAMDLEYWLRIASKFSVTTINEELSAYRWYDDIKTKTGGLKRWVEQWHIINSYSKLQMTPGLLVEFFNVLQEKEVNEHLGINVSEFSQKIRMQFYQVMQQLLNTNECIPKHGNGKIFSPTSKGKSVESSKEKKTLNIVRSLGSKPKIDIVMPEGHSWFVREGYAEALKHHGVFNQSFYVNQKNGNRELFEYLKNPTSDFILLMNTDWHAQYLHTNLDWQKRWEANNSTKILFSFECMNNPTIKKDTRWWNDNITAVDNALKSVNVVVFAHEIDEELFSKYGKPVLWQPFAIDEQLFPQPKKYSERIPKSFFKGKTTPFYHEGTYSQRRKLIDTLKSSNKTEIFDTYEEEKGTTRERALNFISTMNNYQIVLGLPSLSPTMVVRPFEAMASGAVFFQNKIFGERSNKLFTDGVDIINYDEDKPEELLSSIESILNNPESSEQIAEAGYQKVLNNHTIKHRMNEMLGWIENNFTETKITSESKDTVRIATPKTKIVVDGIIFQLQKNQPLGISRVWTSLLTELGKKENNILLLDRGNTAPDIPGIEKISIPLFYDYEVMPSEVCYLDEICFENNAALFISTYYSYTEHTPSLLMLHDFIPELFKWKGSEWSAKEEAIQKAFAYLSVSESTAKDLTKFYPENKNKDVSIIHNAVSDEFSPKSEKQIKAFKKKYKIEKQYFIISGNRNLYKNVIQFAAAFSKLKNKNDYEILFTGGSPELEPDIKKLLGKAKYQIVYLTVDELSTAYSGAVALVYPSKYEGFGLPVIEAMKSGCPVITCKNSSLKEVAGEAAIFIKEDDIESLKNALVKVEKPEVREKHIKAGLENAKKFSWTLSGELLDKKISSYLETYNPIAQKPQPNLGSVDNLFYKIKTDELLSKAYDKLLSQLKKGFEADEELIKQTEKIVGSIDAPKYLLPVNSGQFKVSNYPYYYYVLALSYLNRNDYHKSLEAFSLALSHGLNHWIIGSHLADMLIHFNKFDEALVMLDKIKSIYPQHENTLKRISEIKKGETTKMKEFKVTAIVSTYNSEKFLRGCLDDLINQTLYEKGELEIVVVNSGSTQNEEQIVKEYQNQFANIKYTKTERETVYQAWNRGIKIASGKYLTNANTDDRHRKDALEIFAKELDANDEIGLVYADQFVTKKENQTFEDHDADGYFQWLEFDRIQLIHCACVGPQPMWRKSLHQKFGYFDESLKVAGDYDWWLRISEKVQFKHISEKLGLYLLSENSVEHRYTDEMRNETVKVRLHYGQKAQLKKLDYTKYKSTFLVFTSKEQPLISVIIPTFNRPDKLKDAIASALAQSYKNIEVIVVNDAGKDVADVIKQFNDVRVNLINQETNKGLSASRNIGIKAAKGEYIALLDDDDIFYSNHLQIALNNFSDEHRVIYSDAVRNSYVKVGKVFTLQNQSVPYSIDYDRNKLLIGNIAPVNCFVFEKSLAIKVGLFDESLPVLEDWDFWLRFSSVTGFKHVRENTVQVNWYNDGSTMTSSKGKDFEETRKLINQKYEAEIKSIPNLKEIITEFNAIWGNDFTVGLPLVSIIALSYNQLEYTKSFVESVVKYTTVPFKLILVDNASNNETVEFLNSLSATDKRIKTIFNSTNKGFPKGVNQGINLAIGKYVLIANNDIVVTRGWMERMIEVAESKSEIGLVGPISNSVSGVQLDKAAKYDSIVQMHKYAKQIQKKNHNKIVEFPRVAFLCTLIKKEVIEKIGGLDERFSPGNFEDDDFCLRAQVAGYKTVIAHDVFIHHYGSKSFKANGIDEYAKRLEHNKQVFIDKWGADPEEIWLKGKSFKRRNPAFPIDKDKFTAHIKRAMIYLDDKDYQSALNYLNEVIESYEEYSTKDFKHISLTDLLNLAANAALMTGDYQKASELFEKELNANPTSSRACAGLAETFLTQEKYNEAKTMLEWSVKNDPNNQSARSSLEKVNQELGLPKDDNSLNTQKSVDEQIEEFFAETYSLYEKKLFKDSLTVLIELEKFIDARPEEVKPETAASVFNLSGFNYLALGENDRARQSFEKSLNIVPDSSTACAGLGEIFYLEGKDEEAKTMYEWAVKNDPNNQIALKGLNKINEVLGMEHNHNSLNASPNIDEQLEALFSETYSLYEKKLYKEALAVLLELEKFVTNSSEEIHPDTLVSIINLSGYNYLGLNDVDNARESFERALNINPSSSSACAGLGEIYATFAMDTEAKTMFEWAVKNNPENQTAVSSLAKVNQRLGFAQNHNSLVLKNINPLRIIENKLDLAEELIDKDRNDEAEKLLQEVLASEPTNVIALNNLSVIEIMKEHYEDAIKLISKVLAINPEDEIALTNMNFIKEKLTSVLAQA